SVAVGVAGALSCPLAAGMVGAPLGTVFVSPPLGALSGAVGTVWPGSSDTQRKPIEGVGLPGGAERRCIARRNSGMVSQLPPRSTRSVPEIGPCGFSARVGLVAISL